MDPVLRRIWKEDISSGVGHLQDRKDPLLSLGRCGHEV
jgi:hypothetical protein